MGFSDGRATAYDEYGRRPWDPDYKQPPKNQPDEWFTFHKFQGEFARLFGPYRRGRIFSTNGLEREKDPDDFHSYHLSLEHPRKNRG